jgi:dipeptidyl aminopeptidase/acylaminoacyl peptidase
MMRFVLYTVLLAAAGALSAGEWSLEALYTRPYLWGTTPQDLKWARNKPILAFLWNEQGGRFLDLYVWDAEAKKRVRVTALESVKDPFNPAPDENDDRLKSHRMPETGLSSFSISDDGARVAFAWKGDLYIASTSGGRGLLRLTQTKAGEASPRFSPDGTRLAYTRGGEIFVQDLTGGSIIQLNEASAGAAGQYAWSPDGSRILYLTRGGGGRTQVLMNYSGRFAAARPFPRDVAGDENTPASAWIVPARGGKAVKIGESELGPRANLEVPEWSPDGKQLLLRYIAADRKRAVLAIADAATGKPRTLTEERDNRWLAQSFRMWSPDGKQVAFTSDRTGFIHLYRISVEGGKPEQITTGAWELNTERFGTQPQWAGARIFYTSTEEGTHQRHYYSILPDGTGKQKISQRPGVNTGVASEDGKHTALLSADSRHPFDLYVDGQRVTESPRKEFDSYAWPQTKFIEFPSRGDRKPVKAKLLLPPGYDPGRKDGKKWPCIFFIHGAGIASSVLEQWGSYNELRYVYNAYLANKGYVLMDLDYRGSSGYGREWRTGVYLHMGGPDLDDVLGAVDYLKGLDNVDMNKLGIWGVSYGGFMTNMALFLSPGTFKAGSSWAAVNDWENYNAGYTRERLTTPAENPEAYRRSSPIYFSKNLRDSLMIVHGMVDSNVLFQDAVQLTEKLIQEGKPFEEIFYPQEDHGFVRDETWIDALRRTTAFFDRRLQ